MRSSQRAIWDLDQQPGNLVIRRLVDLARHGRARPAAGAVAVGPDRHQRARSARCCCDLSPQNVRSAFQQAIATIGSVTGILLALLVNCVLAASMLSGVARLRMSFRRLLPSTLLVAVGLLHPVARSAGPTSSTARTARPTRSSAARSRILLFLYLFNQLLLFGAALAATSTRGTVRDLAAGPPPPQDERSGHEI